VKKPIKAVLLSALVFPGAGHIYLKKYISGVLLVGTALVALYLLMSKTMEKAVEISEKLQNGDVQLDIEALMELVSKSSSGADAQLLNMATLALIICWLIGVVGSYRAGSARSQVLGSR
jgi:TM2 domain-containing membrane protein YozV